MNGARRALVAAAFSALVAAPAAADDPATFADRDETGVEDAERTFGLMIDPLSAAEGIFGGDADFALAPRVALSAGGDVYQLSDGNPGIALGLGLLLYPIRRTFYGLVLEPRAVYARPLGEPLTRFTWRTNVVGLGAVAGWQWTWDYGLSVRLGAGALKFVGGGPAPGLALGRDGIDLVLDGSLGWLFQ